jgi:hypothetical protein
MQEETNRGQVSNLRLTHKETMKRRTELPKRAMLLPRICAQTQLESGAYCIAANFTADTTANMAQRKNNPEFVSPAQGRR